MLKIKGGYQLELKTFETMRLFGSTQKLTEKTKSKENVKILKAIEVVLIECNLVGNQYQEIHFYPILLQVNVMLIC